ncbi:MraY family glycosyltransferase [Niveibacterium terrae]|uniref:MraY family glycosyltransferase n=1 Tax=Niveibacterium terrae TaxID=3373598 RepID=UPI003A9258E2
MTPKYLIFPFFCTLLACLGLARLAPWLALMDRPDARKQHGREVPVVGGIAIMLSYVLALKLRGIAGNLTEAMLPVGLMLAVGIVDDVHALSARFKLALQCVAAWLLCRTTGFDLTALPIPGFDAGLPLGPFALPLTMFVILAVINAINMSDGADGLAGGYVFGALLLLLGVALVAGRPTHVLLIVGLMSSIAGFLACNARHPWLARARVFMGDAGALSLGMLICWLAFDLARGKTPAMPPVLLLYAVALPLLDMVTVSVRRILRGVSPMSADRTHLHHILFLKGLSVEVSVVVLWVAHMLLAGCGFLLWRAGASDAVLLALLLGAMLAKLVVMRVWEEVRDPSAPVATPREHSQL